MPAAGHWGRRPRDWAELAEPSNEPLFAEVLRDLGVSAGTRLLDVGCGSGYAARMAARCGATVSGIDITPELVAIARGRLPETDLRAGAMEELPFPDESFDAVTGFNAFQFADPPALAVSEARRVVRAGGLVAATTFAEAERNESTALHVALEPLRGLVAAGATGTSGGAAPAHLPYSLSAPGGLETLVSEAGLAPVSSGEVRLAWAHPTVREAVDAVLASGGGAIAIEAAGEDAARAALEQAVIPYTRADGSVRMRNVFRYVIAQRAE